MSISTFYDLGPGTYIVRSTENDCRRYKYDTVIIGNYQYPNLSRSTGYQCDVNGFSVSAIASNGVGPFTYAIIGSVPALPSIIRPPQPGSIFNINNGSNYSLIRLRAVDACGNATLGDASILPLANNGIIVSNNCFMSSTTLSVDSIFNATYQWYKKDSLNSPDSTFMGSYSTLYIPMLTEPDTGIYTCYVVVNAGCIKRTYHFDLDGSCYVILPVEAELKGVASGRKNLLSWKTEKEVGVDKFVIEKKAGNSAYSRIGEVSAAGNSPTGHAYQYEDPYPLTGDNYYRLRMINDDGSFTYSNTIVLGRAGNESITVYPNPVIDRYTVDFNVAGNHRYKLMLYNNSNQVIQQNVFFTSGNGILTLHRPAGIARGMYLLKVIDLDTNERYLCNILFQ